MVIWIMSAMVDTHNSNPQSSSVGRGLGMGKVGGWLVTYYVTQEAY